MSTSDSTIGFFQGQWVRRESIRISIDDIGFRSGVTAVERLRTYNRRVFELDAHLARFEHTIRELQIEGLPPQEELAELIGGLLTQNATSSPTDTQDDVGITLFATPGEIGANLPTLGLHLNKLDHDRVQRFRTQGQTLAITHVTQPPESSWSRSVKVRCRLHYHRADMLARKLDRDAVGILVDDDGSITETSIANLAVVRDGRVCSPLASQVLGGVTQSVVERLAIDLGIVWTKAQLSPQQVYAADEVFLMGTDNGLWFVNRVDTVTYGGGNPGNIFRSLLSSFDERTRGDRCGAE